MTAYLGRVVRAVLPTVSSSNAGGFWNPVMAQYYQQAGTWPPGGGNDPYFPYVTALLNGDGTNGAQNNTFLDGSSNAYTITRNGNTTQGSASPYFYPGCWSNYFDGAGDYLTCGGSSALAFGAGDFTLEMWVYPTAGTSKMIYDARPSSAAGLYPTLYINGSNAITYFTNGSDRITGASPVLNTWQHVAVVRASGVTKLYINGTQSGSSYTDANTYINGAARPIIGADGGNVASQNYAGYISNLRVVVGVAIYTSNFTPPTTPLTATAQTTLLICNSNAILDKSSTNNTITKVGDTQVSKFSSFSALLAYSSTYGGSMYLDGAGDYLNLPAGTGLNLTTSDMTIEAWVYPTARVTNSAYIISQSSYGVGSDFGFWITSTGTLQFYMTTGGANIVTSTGTVPLYAWTHVAVSRSGTSFKLFINGITDGTLTSSVSITNSFTPTTIGNSTNNTGSVYFPGYIANLRVVRGSAVYTANFTPPTTPVTAISGTQLLLNATNGGIIDAAGIADYETVANAQVSTSVVKYGTGSIAFDGTGDYLVPWNASTWAFGTGDWTIECWVYFNSVASTQYVFDTRANATSTSGVALNLSSTAFPVITVNNVTLFTSSTAIAATTWTHVALVKSSGTITLYLNGTKPVTGSGASSTSLTDQYLTIGTSIGNRDATATNHMNGYIDDFRITNGYARYTTNFTAPGGPFPTY